MGRYTITQQDYLNASQIFHWATKEHFKTWFTGKFGVRHRRTEVMLPRLVRKKKLVAVRHGRCLVYAAPRRMRRENEVRKIEHGLAVTESLIRFWFSDRSATIIDERFFYGLGAVPEFGLKYPSGKMLLFEYCSLNNFERTSRLASKIYRYSLSIRDINQKFNANSLVLFVVDVPKARLINFQIKYGGSSSSCYFTDYQSFLSVPFGEQLTAPIYYWADDLEARPLRNNDRDSSS